MGNNANAKPQQGQQTAVVTIDKMATSIANSATKWILDSMTAGEISVPAGYNVGSEVALAMMKIAQTTDRTGTPAVKVCTKDSIITALRQMAMNGLSMAQNQCYAIVYGNQLQIQRSYFGALAILRRIFPMYDITASVVYKGDKYEYGYDELTDCYFAKITEPKIENRNPANIELVFGTIRNKETKEVIFSEVMTMAEIKRSWAHAKTTKVHEEHPDQMAKRTLLNRMCKLFVNTYPLDPAQAYAYNQSVEDEYDNSKVETEAPATPSSTREYAKQASGGNAGLSAVLNSTEVEDIEAVEVQDNPANAENKEEEPATEAPATPEEVSEEIPF